MKKIILILSLTIAVFSYGATTNKIAWEKLLLESDWKLSNPPDLDDVFNIAEDYLLRYETDRAAQIYKLILEKVPKKELIKFRFDNCSGEFIVNAGLCLSAANKFNSVNVCGFDEVYKNLIMVSEKNYLLTNDFYFMHGKKAYKIAMKTSDGCRNILRLEKLLWGLAELAPKGEKEKYIEHALELFDYHTADSLTKYILHVWEIYLRGNPLEATKIFDKILRENPRFFPVYYSKMGWPSIELEDYRNAIRIWLRGMRLVHIWNFGDFSQDRLKEIKLMLPFFNQNELEELIGIIIRRTAQNPPLTKNVAEIAQWLNLINDPQLKLEMKLRELEEGQSPEYKTLLSMALKEYEHPENARKLGEYKLAAELYCKRIKECRQYFRLRYYMKKFEQLKDKIDSETFRKYRNALDSKVKDYNIKSDKNKFYPELVEEIKSKVKELDAKHPAWKEKEIKTK